VSPTSLSGLLQTEADAADMRARLDQIREICGLPVTALVSTVGRGDLKPFFGKSGLFDGQGWRHHQALAFLVQGALVQVRICSSPAEVLKLPDATPLMQQWPGKYDSDWFCYTVADLRAYWQPLVERATAQDIWTAQRGRHPLSAPGDRGQP
jgi:hypothetical protein